MTDPDFEIFREEMMDLIEDRAGSVHRDKAFEHLYEVTDLSEDRIRFELRQLNFNERGIIYLDDGNTEASNHGGNISRLKRTPGQVTTDDVYGLTLLEDIGHRLVPAQDEYLERQVLNSEASDVELICRTMADADFSPLLLGEAGTGKDALIRYVCNLTNRPMVRVNFGSDVRYEDLVGMYVIDDEGEMRWRDGLLTAAVKYGWTFVADEINAAPPESTMPLHQVTEEENESELVLRERGKIVEPHAQFRFVATMNPPHGGYGGTNRLNDAFKSRFYTIHVDYLPPERETELLVNRFTDTSTNINESQLQTLAQMAERLRENYKRSDIVTPITTRELIKACKLSEMEKLSLKEAARIVLYGHAKESDRDVVEEIIETYF